MRATINPFATRYVAPGRLPWVEGGEHRLDELADRFRLLGRRVEIVGPHGSGKTTLLRHLVPRLGKIKRYDAPQAWAHPYLGASAAPPASGGEPAPLPVAIDRSPVYWYTLRKRDRVVRKMTSGLCQLQPGSILVLDGFEQLSWWLRMIIRGWTARRKIGLVVTSHRSAGLPTLHRTQVTSDLARHIVQALWQQHFSLSNMPAEISQLDWPAWLSDHDGNFRECLMKLYDAVEIRLRQSAEAAVTARSGLPEHGSPVFAAGPPADP